MSSPRAGLGLRADNAVHGALRILDHICRAFGNVLMIGSPLGGLVIIAALAIEPLNLIGGLLGLSMAEVCLYGVGQRDGPRAKNARANAILAGVAAAWLVAPSQQPFYAAAILIASVSSAAAFLSTALTRALANTPVPAMSLAFIITFAVLLTLLPYWAAHAAFSQPFWPYPVGISGWLDSFLRSLGIILFSPRPETGAAVFAALLFWSPAMAISGVVGWIAGILTAEVLADFGFNWLWLIAADNSFITAMLLGAVFHLPSRSTLATSALAGIGAAVLALAVQTAFRGTGWAFQPLPALLTTWIALLALSGRSARHPIVATPSFDLAPEQAWQQARLFEARFGAPAPLVAVPLAGVVAVSQGFDGPISHRGPWRHGIDFEMPIKPGLEAGSFGAPVYCPTDGTVESLTDNVPDNPLGVSNYSQNWGNYIVIRMDQGLWLMLAHLAKDSIRVAAGQRVRTGQVLAAVGNSGRSPTPHLHLHVQTGPMPGAPTIFFNLANYLGDSSSAMTGAIWLRAGVPKTGTFVRAALKVPATFRNAAGLAPGVGLWRIRLTDEMAAPFWVSEPTEQLSTTLDPAGNHCVVDNRHARLVLHADVDSLRVYELSGRPGLVLRLWSMALPVVPYCATPGLCWFDRIDPPPSTLLERIALPAAPYLARPLADMRLRCTAIAAEAREEIIVEAEPVHQKAGFPTRIVARLAGVIGPVAFEAYFEEGSVLAELISFAPVSSPENAGEQRAPS